MTVLLLSHCGTGPEVWPEPKAGGIEYYPIEDGTYWIYRVDSIHYNSFNTLKPIDTFQYWVRESLVERLDFDTLFIHQKVEREISLDTGKTWKFDRFLQISRSDLEALRMDHGKRVLKLVFPIKPSASWNANHYNTDEPFTSNYYTPSNAILYKDSAYTSGVGIRYRNNVNLIRVDTEDEIYIAHLGNVYRERKDLTYKDLEQTKADGFSVRYTLIDFNR